MHRWSSTSGRASRTRIAAVGQATRQWRHSLQSSATTPSEEGRAPWSVASGRSATEKLTRVPSPAVDVTLQAVAVALDVRQAHAGAEAERAGLGGGRRQALAHRRVDVGDAGAVVDDVDVELAVAHGGLETAAVIGVDDDVHLGLVGGDHRAADGVALGADPLEVLLEVARGRAGAREVPAADVVGQVLHGSGALAVQSLVDEAAGLEHALRRDHEQRVVVLRRAGSSRRPARCRRRSRCRARP